MLEAGDELIEALQRDTVVWAPMLEADWARDGYGTETDSIDNLAGQQAGSAVVHSEFDGLPSEVTFLDQSGVPTLTAGLTGRGVGGQEMNATRYFSPFRTDSPLYGIERDGTPIRLEQGAVTEEGVQRLRLFTGQIANVQTPPGSPARVQGVSASRFALSQPVQPPPIFASTAGWGSTEELLTGTWLASWVLHRCGVYPSPPPVPGCVTWFPFHGGYWSFFQGWDIDLQEPLAISGSPDLGAGTFSSTTEDSWRQALPRWVPGPYVAGLNGYVSTESVRSSYLVLSESPIVSDVDREPTCVQAAAKWFRQNENIGRVQMYIRGDDVNWDNLTPSVTGDDAFGGPPLLPSNTFTLSTVTALGATDDRVVAWGAVVQLGAGASDPSLAWWIDQDDRRVRMRYFDGTDNHDVTSTNALPTDGLWHFLGLAWSISNGRLAINLDGVVDSYSDPTMDDTGLAEAWPGLTTDIGADQVSGFSVQFVPTSEWQLSTGDDADPTLNPTWMADMEWTRLAEVHPSSLNMVAIGVAEPMEGYELLQVLAQAESAHLFIDGSDVCHYRPVGHYATADQQVVTETITTERHARVPDIRLDSTRLRNIVGARYKRTRQEDLTPALSWRTALEVPPGTTIYRIPYSAPPAFGTSYDEQYPLLTAVDIADLESGIATLSSFIKFVALNTSSDGSGTPVETGVVVRVAASRLFDTELKFTNDTAATYYVVADGQMANGEPIPYIHLGTSVQTSDESVLEVYDTSVTTHGPRFVSTTLPWPMVGSEVEASQMARRILGLTHRPLAVVNQLEAFGDPRREPGDLVRVQDPAETGVDEQFRTAEIIHTISPDGSGYTQTMRLQQALGVGEWGDGVSVWGQALWAGQQNPGIYGEE